MENNTYTYNVTDIFEEIPEDPKNMLMKLPPEICQEIGLIPGDTVKLLIGDQGTLIIEKVKKDQDDKEQ